MSQARPTLNPPSAGARIVGGEGNASGPGPEVMAADTLQGDKVVNRGGDDLGTIEDIMIDVQRGRVAYAVMSCGGFLGMGDRLFAIPWNALTLEANRHCFVLDADRERFQKAPGFDKAHWPSMADNSWATRVHEFYGVSPYWSDTGSMAMSSPASRRSTS
ncbi:MAG TPA: PRC-barrel domain-containing protein [Usitatibacter sp.]|nr:PRC-barrel domain-containing protein [Usitatibacter sp.]